jgi:hypothetical protein
MRGPPCAASWQITAAMVPPAESLDCVFGDPACDEHAVLDCRWERVLRSKPIIDRDHSAAACVGEHATEAIVRREVAEDTRTAVEVNHARQRVGLRVERRVGPYWNRVAGRGHFALADAADRNTARIGGVSELIHRSA